MMWVTAWHCGACAGCGDRVLTGDTVAAATRKGRRATLCRRCGRVVAAQIAEREESRRAAYGAGKRAPWNE